MRNSHCQKIEGPFCFPEKSNKSFQKVRVFNLAHSIRFSIAPCKMFTSTDIQIVSVADPDFSYEEFSKVETKKYDLVSKEIMKNNSSPPRLYFGEPSPNPPLKKIEKQKSFFYCVRFDS